MAPDYSLPRQSPDWWFTITTSALSTVTTHAVVTYTTSTGGFASSFAAPSPEPKPLTKAERARLAMRVWLADLAPEQCQAREPARPVLVADAPLLEHKKRCFRRTPRRPGMGERVTL
jgi:hypothetical protein